MAGRRYQKLSDHYIETVSDFIERGDPAVIVWDKEVKGLQVRCGSQKITWTFVVEYRRGKKRGMVFKRLGFFPVMTVKEARRAAKIEAGRAAAGRIEPGRRQAIKVADAVKNYLATLSGGWARVAASLARLYILPELGGMTLAELANAPALVRDWHSEIKSATSADHAARILSATYKHAAKLNRSLPPHNPCSAVNYHPLVRSQKALAFKDFPKWRAAWDGIDDQSRKAYAMIALLSGMRSGELARLKWSDVLPRERCFVIRESKSGDDIRVPLSLPMVRELKRARDAAVAAGQGSAYVFPGRYAGSHIAKFSADGLPAYGMMLRRTYRTICAELGIDELRTHMLMGHKPQGISAGYLAKLILSSGRAMRADQRRISADIVHRLGVAL